MQQFIQKLVLVLILLLFQSQASTQLLWNLNNSSVQKKKKEKEKQSLDGFNLVAMPEAINRPNKCVSISPFGMLSSLTPLLGYGCHHPLKSYSLSKNDLLGMSPACLIYLLDCSGHSLLFQEWLGEVVFLCCPCLWRGMEDSAGSKLIPKLPIRCKILDDPSTSDY